MLIFLSGGAKNGKTLLAQQLCKRMAKDAPLYYLATMIPHDNEDRARIARHLQEREGWGFETLEWGKHLGEHMKKTPRGGTVLMDSVTALLANEMFPGSIPDWDAPRRLEAELLTLCDWADNIVFISDFIYSDAGRYDTWTEAYRRGLARLDRALCARCDTAAELCASAVTIHKGAFPE